MTRKEAREEAFRLLFETEFRTEEDWAYIARVVKMLAGNDKIWYATNIEIYDYVNAQKQIRRSADGKIFYNPTDLDVWVAKDAEPICIPAGKSVTID